MKKKDEGKMETELKKENQNGSADPFTDISKMRMSQEFANEIGLEKLITKITVGKPNKQWWVRVNRDPKYRFETALLEIKDKNEMYLVAPDLWSPLADEIIRVVIFVGINRQGVIFFWVVRLPGADGKHNEWHQSALKAATIAMDHWVRVTANQSAKGYDVAKSKDKLDEPKWPDVAFEEMFKIAFKDLFIDSMDHAVLKELRGEV
jgi:hypothetical protein